MIIIRDRCKYRLLSFKGPSRKYADQLWLFAFPVLQYVQPSLNASSVHLQIWRLSHCGHRTALCRISSSKWTSSTALIEVSCCEMSSVHPPEDALSVDVVFHLVGWLLPHQRRPLFCQMCLFPPASFPSLTAATTAVIEDFTTLPGSAQLRIIVTSDVPLQPPPLSRLSVSPY